MSTMMTRRRLVAAASAFGLIAPAARANAQTMGLGKAPCDSERSVSGWRVSAGLYETAYEDVLISNWECEKSFSEQLALSIALDTSEGKTPSILIRHDNRGGRFVMRLPDQTAFSVSLDANYTVTQANVPDHVIASLSKSPLVFEHSAPGRSYNQYKTDGLPEAIAAAKTDLSKLETAYDKAACDASEGCFFTTAACGVVGLPDDCFELRQLRAFRDRFASRAQDNRQAVETYYRLAPHVLSALERRPDAKRILLNEYWRGIVPCALLSALGCDGVVAWLYKGVLKRLQAYAAQ